jgi:8-oxo-dGTP pyrophosphatase MutT (NUDIX family)
VEAAREDDGVIRAAGGVIVRDGRVLLVHRPRYDDWSLPKGKCKRKEGDEACALREVEEETGLRCEIERPVAESRYHALAGPKVVQWFLMRCGDDGAFEPGDEVDQVEWVPIEEAGDRLTYERDARVLADATRPRAR